MKSHLNSLSSLRIYIYLVLFGIGCLNFSCVNPKAVVYFQGDTTRISSSPVVNTYTPTIQVNDMLSIVVGSLNPEANEIFNSINSYTTTSTSYSGASANSRQPFGYLVDSEGNIELPLAGKIRLEGLKLSAAADTIRRRLTVYLKEPSVTIRNLNFKVSVLGEVKQPSVYVIPDEKITLPEVLSLAGDLTIYGKRTNVMIIREEKGVRQYARLDLTSRDVFESPFYYIHKNDIIYVEPVKTRIASTDRVLQLTPLIVSIVSVVSIVIYRFAR
ncbi:polysaccharide biosynthesis/export family protein [Dyadobacter aurulentus]|uniref:polysaccharide biosynthesis/export family protein n=1 Tax=Dyadobacter sp. UC 10 TaxID=2605428 RepID=UPI0011F3E64E|nr:polysaccharide biosynthesis/export family protein [Dyadobacter sp. UC 10]KAA0988862.1 polysaccharide export protein [Dyadobacter sp. UC 10]